MNDMFTLNRMDLETLRDSDTISENMDNNTDNASECVVQVTNVISTTPGVLVENESTHSQSQQPHSPQISSLHFDKFENEERPYKKRVFKLEFSPTDSPVTGKFKSKIKDLQRINESLKSKLEFNDMQVKYINDQNQKLQNEAKQLQQQIHSKGQEQVLSQQSLIEKLKQDKIYLRNKLNQEISNHNIILQQRDQDLENERKHQDELFQSRIKSLQFEHIQQIKQKESEILALQTKLGQLQNQLKGSKEENVILETEHKKQIAQLEKDLYYHKV